MICGLDVSAAQGRIDFDALPPWVSYLFVKSTEGTAFVDATFARNRDEAKRRGVPWSPYHFCRPSQDALAQSMRLWTAIGPVMPDFRVAIDVENGPDDWTPQKLLYWVLTMIDAVEASFGLPPILYTYPWFEGHRLAPAVTPEIAPRLARCPLWMADYAHGESPPDGAKPFVPHPWDTWTFWQTSGNGSSRVPGISGAVDHDLFNGDADAFRIFRGLPDPTATQPEAIVHPPVEFPPREPPSEE